jgi:hypothetical protein
MKGILMSCIMGAIHIADAIITLLLSRWLLELSTPEKDILWLKKQPGYQDFTRLKFYRGTEYMHQLRARRILAS